MMRAYKKYLRRIRNFDLAICLAFVLSVPLNIMLHLHGGDDFDLEEILDGSLFNAIADRDVIPEALFDFACLCTTLSAFRYAGRAIDVLSNEKSPLYPFVKEIPAEVNELHGKKYRNAAILIGMVLALLLAIALAAILFSTGIFSPALLLTFLVGSLGLFSACTGLLSRLGQVIDRKALGKSLNRHYELSILGSAALSLIPITFTVLHFLATVVGSITPLGIFTLASTCLVLMSSLTSVSHYIGLSLDFLTNEKTLFSYKSQTEPSQKQHWLDRCNNEKLATTAGIVLGLALGISLVCLGICMPAFLLALPLVLKAPLIVLLTINLCASLSANVGRVIDRLLTGQNSPPSTLIHLLFNYKLTSKTSSPNVITSQSDNHLEHKSLIQRKRHKTWSGHTHQQENKIQRLSNENHLISNAGYKKNGFWQFQHRRGFKSQNKQENYTSSSSTWIPVIS